MIGDNSEAKVGSAVKQHLKNPFSSSVLTSCRDSLSQNPQEKVIFNEEIQCFNQLPSGEKQSLSSSFQMAYYKTV